MNRRSFLHFIAVAPVAVPVAAVASVPVKEPLGMVPMQLASGERVDVTGVVLRLKPSSMREYVSSRYYSVEHMRRLIDDLNRLAPDRFQRDAT